MFVSVTVLLINVNHTRQLRLKVFKHKEAQRSTKGFAEFLQILCFLVAAVGAESGLPTSCGFRHSSLRNKRRTLKTSLSAIRTPAPTWSPKSPSLWYWRAVSDVRV